MPDATTKTMSWSEMSDEDLDDFFNIPTVKAEFLARAERDRKRVAKNPDQWMMWIPLFKRGESVIDDDEFQGRVAALWATINPATRRSVRTRSVKERGFIIARSKTGRRRKRVGNSYADGMSGRLL